MNPRRIVTTGAATILAAGFVATGFGLAHLGSTRTYTSRQIAVAYADGSGAVQSAWTALDPSQCRAAAARLGWTLDLPTQAFIPANYPTPHAAPTCVRQTGLAPAQLRNSVSHPLDGAVADQTTTDLVITLAGALRSGSAAYKTAESACEALGPTCIPAGPLAWLESGATYSMVALVESGVTPTGWYAYGTSYAFAPMTP